MCAFYYVHWPHNLCSYQNQCFLCSPADSGNCSVVMSLIKTLFFWISALGVGISLNGFVSDQHHYAACDKKIKPTKKNANKKYNR